MFIENIIARRLVDHVSRALHFAKINRKDMRSDKLFWLLIFLEILANF